MLIDIYYNESNYGTYNVKCANLFGLTCAVYLSELLDIYQKAYKKNKLDEDNYFKLDRKYIQTRTTLDKKQQKELDDILCAVKVLELKDDDHLKIDVDYLTSILTSRDIDTLSAITKECKYQSKEQKRENRQSAIIENLKNSIECSNIELKDALRQWVDSACERYFLNKNSIKSFVDVLNNYTKGDLDIALEIVSIATEKSYKECQWAINVYEKLHPQRLNSNKEVTTRDTINKDIIF